MSEKNRHEENAISSLVITGAMEIAQSNVTRPNSLLKRLAGAAVTFGSAMLTFTVIDKLIDAWTKKKEVAQETPQPVVVINANSPEAMESAKAWVKSLEQNTAQNGRAL